MELQSLHNLIQIYDETHKCQEIVAVVFDFLGADSLMWDIMGFY
jgi:hypothetical protein